MKNLFRDACWLFPPSPSASLAWAISEAMELACKLGGDPPKLGSALSGSLSIIVGSPASHPMIRQASERGVLDLRQLTSEDDYRIRSTSIDGKECLLLAGGNDRAALYGLFAFFELLGCRFYPGGDVLPDFDPDLSIPDHLDLTGHSDCTWRSVWLGFEMATESINSLSDYRKLFGQLAKMRFNRVLYYIFENEPFIDYTYKGERKLIGDNSHVESACMALGRQDAGSYRVADSVIAGKEKFTDTGRHHVAPLEFQNVRTSDDLLDTGRAFMQQLIRMATERGLSTWLSFDSTFVSLNMAKYIRRMARPSECYGALTSFTDPVVTEINRNRVQRMLEDYPGIEGIFLQITEGAYEDPYPDSQKIIDREWSKYEQAYGLMQKHWGKHWVGEQKQRTFMRADIGFVERMKRTIESAKQVKPDLKLGVLTVCKAYLLTHLHEVLPKDMPFVDIESQSLWTVDGAPLHLFQQMKGRTCVLVPRAYDDGSLAGLQFNLNLYQRDGFLASRKNNGTSGLCIQLTHMTGNDHNIGFLAQGMWNQGLAPAMFYRDYATSLFGQEAAQDVCRAFEVLESNEQFLGGRGNKNLPYSLKPLELHAIKYARHHATPFFSAPWTTDATHVTFSPRVATYRQAMQNLEIALSHLRRARPLCRANGLDDLDGIINRTAAYRAHLHTLAMIPDVFHATIQAFELLDGKGAAACRDKLAEAFAMASNVEQNAIDAARQFADCARSSTDLGVVWMVNHIVIGTRILRQYLANVLAFYDGREYWDKVDWELFQDTSPFPMFAVEGADTMVFG